MPVLGPQRNMLEMFINNQTEYAIDPDPQEPSGRPIIPENVLAKLKQRKAAMNNIIEQQGQKEKRQEDKLNFEDPADQMVASTEVEAPHVLRLPPWAPTTYQYIQDPCMALHQEIVDWMRYMQPRRAENALRNVLVNRLVNMLVQGKEALFPEAKVHVFGSLRTRLLVPSSDVDITVVGNIGCENREALERISSKLEVLGLCSDHPKVISARVSIVKFNCKISKISCDISVNGINGRHNTYVVQKMLKNYPQAVPLILILKTYLRQRKMNEVFTGGLSSYSISLMVIHMLQMFHSQPNRSECLGKLLLDFFNLYGYHLNIEKCALSLRSNGCYVLKSQCQAVTQSQPRRPSNFPRMAIEDPQNPENDVAGGSSDMHLLVAAFKQAFLALTARAPPQRPGEVQQIHAESPYILNRPTLLNRILNVDRELLIQRDSLEAAYEELLAANPNESEELYESDYEEVVDAEERNVRRKLE